MDFEKFGERILHQTDVENLSVLKKRKKIVSIVVVVEIKKPDKKNITIESLFQMFVMANQKSPAHKFFSFLSQQDTKPNGFHLQVLEYKESHNHLPVFILSKVFSR